MAIRNVITKPLHIFNLRILRTYSNFRSCYCKDVITAKLGSTLDLAGWIHYKRFDKFIVLRDHTGLVQLNLDGLNTDVNLLPLGFEDVIQVRGKLMERPDVNINPSMESGRFEIKVDHIALLNKANNLPYVPSKASKVSEVIRFKHRYLDLRQPQNQLIFRMRSHFMAKVRQFLVDTGFVEIETPSLTKRTDGGASEFIVPTSKPGMFYALPQSPQLYKQLLMAGGFDKYFQVARCFRDETSTPERQVEFTQLDLEMAFAAEDDIKLVIEQLLKFCFTEKSLSTPFPVLSYSEAMSRFGSDKPDIRISFELFTVVDDKEIRAFNGGHLLKQFSKSQLKKFCQEMEESLGRSLSCCFIQNNSAVPIVSHSKLPLLNSIHLQEGDVIFMAKGPHLDVSQFLGKVRLSLANKIEEQGIRLRCPNDFKFVWIEKFPLFEQGTDGILKSAHHPFTAPLDDHLNLLTNSPLQTLSRSYDLVLNGAEIGGGSVRVHSAELQRQLLRMLNLDASQFEHLLNGLEHGCPPHAGIALGIDRLLKLIFNTSSIRDVIAFPKTSEGQDLLFSTPHAVDSAVLEHFHICIKSDLATKPDGNIYS